MKFRKYLPFSLWCGATLSLIPLAMVVMGWIYIATPYANDTLFFRYNGVSYLLQLLIALLVIGMVKSWWHPASDTAPVPRWQLLLLGLEAMAALLSAIVFILFLTLPFFLNARGQALLHAQNAVFSPEELAVKYPPPQANANTLLRQIIAVSGSTLNDVPASIPSDCNEELHAELQSNTAVIMLIDQLDASSICTFERNWEAGMEMAFPEYRAIDKIYHLNLLRLACAVKAQDQSEILRLWNQLSTVNAWLLADPVQRPFMLFRQLQILENILQRTTLSNAALRDLSAQCERWEKLLLPDYRTCLDAKNIMLDISYRGVPDWFTPQTCSYFYQRPTWLPQWPLWLINQYHTRRLLARMMAIAPMEHIDAREEFQALQTEIAFNSRDLTNIIMQEYLRDLVLDYLRVNRTLARLRITRCAMASILYYRANGCWPQRLEVLVPEFLDELPRDPFSGEALRLVNGYFDYPQVRTIMNMAPDTMPLRRVFRIYSIGEDGDDNKGFLTIREWGIADDIAFSLYDVNGI